jgi:hypothetical protein
VSATIETEDARTRLLDAATTRASVRHPHLLRAHVVRNAEGRLGMVMERCSAPTLRQVLAAGPLERNVSIMALGGVASAVDALASYGLVPRELTPDGILMHRKAGVILADHALPPDLFPRAAPEDDPGLAYRSPEELNQGQVDARSSVYSLGAILLVCMTGKEPPDPRRPAPSGWVPGSSPGLDRVIKKAMAGQPGHRYPDALALARAAHAAVRLPPDPEPARTRKPVRAAARAKAAGRVTAARLRALNRPRPAAVAAPPLRLIVVATVLATAAGGIALDAAGDGWHPDLRPQPQPPSRASAGPLSLQLPSGWKEASLKSHGSIPLSFEVSGTPSRGGGATLVAGVTRDVVAAERFLDDSRAGGTTPTQARLGRLHAWHYTGLHLGSGLTGSAYVAYTTGPSIVVLCMAPASEAHALRACNRAAPTVRVRGERPVSRAVEGRRRVAAVRTALRDLNLARVVGRQRLAEAVGDEQRDAARALQVAYRAAARAVEGSGIPGARAGLLLAGLRDAGEAYGDLATAIAQGDQSAYDAARAAVLDSEGVVWNETDR